MKKQISKDNSAIGYVRVSTYEQAVGGISLETQMDNIRTYCTLRGLNLIEIISDPGTSAGIQLSERNGGRELLSTLISRKASSLVVVKLDRLFRDTIDCLMTIESWDKKDTSLHIIDFGGQTINTKESVGKFLITVLAGVAELEKNRIRERTSEAMQYMKREGKYTGGKVPYGFRVNKNKELEPYWEEQVIIEKIISAHNIGTSVSQIIKELNDENYQSRSNAPFSRTQICKIINNYENMSKARARQITEYSDNQYTGEK